MESSLAAAVILRAIVDCLSPAKVPRYKDIAKGKHEVLVRAATRSESLAWITATTTDPGDFEWWVEQLEITPENVRQLIADVRSGERVLDLRRIMDSP